MFSSDKIGTKRYLWDTERVLELHFAVENQLAEMSISITFPSIK